MQTLPFFALRFRPLKLGLLLIACCFGSGTHVVFSYQNPPLIEESIPESIRDDAAIVSLVGKLKLARRSLAGIGAAHPSYGKTRNTVEQLEASLANEIKSLTSNPESESGDSPTDNDRPDTGSYDLTGRDSERLNPRNSRSRRAGNEVDGLSPNSIDLPKAEVAFERLPFRQMARIGTFPGTRVLWGLEAGDDPVSSRLWKWGDFGRATSQKVLLESEEKILDIQFPVDFLQSDICYALTAGEDSGVAVVRLLQWQILDAGDPTSSGRRQTEIGFFPMEIGGSGRFAGGYADPLVVLLEVATQFVPRDERETLSSPDHRSFLIDTQSGEASQETFKTVAETSRIAWESWDAFGPVAVTSQGLLFVSDSAKTDSDYFVDGNPPAFLMPSPGDQPLGPFVVCRSSNSLHSTGCVVFVGDDLQTVHRIQLSRDGIRESSPIATSPKSILTLGESSDGAILLSTEEGMAKVNP